MPVKGKATYTIMSDYKTSDCGRSAGLHLDLSFSVSDERITRPGQLRASSRLMTEGLLAALLIAQGLREHN
jgi:hypothetical protein